MEKDLDRFMNASAAGRDNLRMDSKQVGRGDVFVAVKGTSHDGHDFIKDAFKKGASGVVAERVPEGLSEEEKKRVLIVPDVKEALSYMAKRAFDDPSSALEVYGITGTNGKTTSVFLTDSILNAAGRKSGYLSTVFNKTSGDTTKRSLMTTSDLISLNRMLAEMVASGKKAAVVEVSSHALDQERTGGVTLNGAVFTNLTPEHLDYHKSMGEYLKAKARIFGKIKPGGTAALNGDDPMVISLKGRIDVSHLITFGMGRAADVRADNIKLMTDATDFDLIVKGLGTVRITTPLIGRHNIYNMMGVAAMLSNSGIDLAVIKKGLEKVRFVPGRLDAVVSKAPFGVYVDYAHTPNALENVLKSLRPIAGKRLICVFGCGGDRDRTKRPVMGKIAADICDHVILTSDNPRSEKPGDILREIQNGMLEKNNYSIIENREDAIRRSLGMAGAGDIVIIAGKGHEDYQILGEKVIHFDDKEVAANVLNEMGY
jgi:UDP-N-acetylmuramoyl-L-alanyl-D-glutamate--2,6-diaminopimelate ligase